MDITLPQLAEGADSGTVVSVLVSEGDQVEKDQPIIELENEKAVAPIPSTAAGVVTKIFVNEGDTISVGHKIATIDTDGKGAEKKPEKPKKEEVKEQAEPEVEEPSTETKPEEFEAGRTGLADPILNFTYVSKSGFPPPASPTVKKIANQVGIDLTKIRGSAKGGRILVTDLKAYVQRLQEIVFKELAQAEKKEAPKRKPESIDFSQWGPVESKPLSGVRKTISTRLQDTWATTPHVFQFDEADITNLMQLRSKYKDQYKKKEVSLTLTGIAMKAVVKALQKFPIFNTSLDEAKQEIVYKQYFHIAIAVDTETGLVVPVIRDVDKKSLFDLSKELAEYAQKARDRKLQSDEMKGSSFTISNLGGIGGTHFTPIVNKPNVAILGMGRGVVRPILIKDQFQARTILPLCVSYDHRVIDGADGARFIKEVVNQFENFDENELKI